MSFELQTPVKHLLVDLDGTLLGNKNFSLSIDFVKQSLNTLRKYGGWRKSIGTLIGINDALKRKNPDLTNDKRVIELFAKRMKMDHEKSREFLRESLFSIFPNLEKHFYPVQGAKDFLEWAHGKFPLTLATNPVWPPEIVELRVRWAGLDSKLFTSMTHIRRMHACKPEPEYYQEILAQEGLKAEDCMLIGDDTKMDLPATRVGIRVFIVGDYKKPHAYPPRKNDALAYRGSYKDLKKLLETI
jgi:FMN phosphatase YigB (HAD superfamily)